LNKTELLFAPWAIGSLKAARGPKWRKLIENIARRQETDPDALALQLLMVRLNGCLTCDARKYSERGGCAQCSRATLAFSKETEDGLIDRFRRTRTEISHLLHIQKQAIAKAA
jgi:hypothetical protein